jgi:N utilization substance protein A
MRNLLAEALSQIEKSKGISKETLISAIEDTLLTVYKKRFAGSGEMKIRLDIQKGSASLFIPKEVVANVLNPKNQISLEDAKKRDERAKIGDRIDVEYAPSDLSRIAAQIAKQVITQRIREAEREVLYKEFKEREGDVATGVIRKVADEFIFVDVGKTEAILPRREQVKKEKYRVGDRIKAYIVSVKPTSKHPKIILSRTHPHLVKKLFESEVPEISENIVKVERVAREPGLRSKVAISTKDKRLDPVGTCVGVRGSRVQAVISELRGEKIDIIPYTDEIEEFITASISPAKVKRLIVNKKKEEAVIIVDKDQLSLAIGRDGQNVRLAAKLTKFKLDVRSPRQYWEERKVEEIPGVGDRLKKGLRRAKFKFFKDIGRASVEDLIKVKGIGKKRAKEILEYVASEKPKEDE